MIRGFDNIIDIDRRIRYPYRIRLENIACLLPGQTTALDMIRIICQVNLSPMIYPALYFSFFLLAQCI